MVNQSIAPAPMAMPSGTTIFGPNRGTRKFVWTCAVMTMNSTIGRNAVPVCIGPYPSVSCR